MLHDLLRQVTSKLWPILRKLVHASDLQHIGSSWRMKSKYWRTIHVCSIVLFNSSLTTEFSVTAGPHLLPSAINAMRAGAKVCNHLAEAREISLGLVLPFQGRGVYSECYSNLNSAVPACITKDSIPKVTPSYVRLVMSLHNFAPLLLCMSKIKEHHYWMQLHAALIGGQWQSPTPARTPNGSPISWSELFRKFNKHCRGFQDVAEVALQTRHLANLLLESYPKDDNTEVDCKALCSGDTSSHARRQGKLDMGGEIILAGKYNKRASIGYNALKVLKSLNYDVRWLYSASTLWKTFNLSQTTNLALAYAYVLGNPEDSFIPWKGSWFTSVSKPHPSCWFYEVYSTILAGPLILVLLPQGLLASMSPSKVSEKY